MELDTTKLKQAGFRKTVTHDNCNVLDIGSGSYPRYIEVRPPGDDGSRMTAIWDGSLDLAVNDKVKCIEYSGNPIWAISAMGGADTAVGKIRVNKVFASDFSSESIITDATDNVTINTGTLALPSDIIHLGDADNKISFTDDVQTFTVGGEALLTLTEAAQDVVKIGDGGDVDIDFGQMFLLGSNGGLAVNHSSPTSLIDVSGSTALRSGILSDPTLTDGTDSMIGLEVAPGTVQTNSSGAFYGINSAPVYSGTTGTQAAFFGMVMNPIGAASNTITAAYGGFYRVDNFGAGTITNAYATKVNNPSGAGPITNNYGLHVQNLTRGTNNWAIFVDGTTLSHFGGAIEFAEMTTPAAGATNTARLFARDDGGGDTELCVRFNTGLIQVIAPLEFGGISVIENAAATTISTAGVAVQILVFDTNEPNNGTTPDHTNDHVTVNKAGTYLITCAVTLISVAGAGAKFHLDIQKNNGATVVGQIHTDRNLSGGGGDAGSATMSGLAVLSSGDTIEAWITNETNTQNIIIEDINLAITMIGVNA